MGRLEEAKGRLDSALARLEKAARQGASPVSDPESEAALEASRARCAALESQTQEVSDRLEAAIERLRTVLKEDENNGAG